MTDLTTTEPGWYPDPLTPGQLRLWDGQGWTDHIRTAPASLPVPARGPGVAIVPRPTTVPAQTTASQGWPAHALHALAGRRRHRLAGLLAAGVVLVVTGALLVLNAGGHGHRAPASAAVGAAAAVKKSSSAVCDLARARPSASKVVAWFKTRGISVKPSAAARLPHDACSITAFRDATNQTVVNSVTAYPTPGAASAAAEAIGGGATAYYIYVLRLSPDLTAAGGTYQAAFTALFGTFSPYTPPPTRHS